MDFDNDGWKDIFFVQSHVMDTIQVNEPHLRYMESPVLLWNDHGKRFVDVSSGSGEVFQQKWASRAMAVGDINNDGNVDVVFSSIDGPGKVLLNETQSHNHWITLKLVGTRSNRDGIGAQVKVSSPSNTQYGTVTTASSYQASSDKRLHFGLGGDSAITHLDIRWPSGIKQDLSAVKADQILTVTEPSSPGK